MKTVHLPVILTAFLFNFTSSVMSMDEDPPKTCPPFPLHLSGHKIALQDYSITGKAIKAALRDSPAITEGLTDAETYFGFGITGTNLREYEKILDCSCYVMKMIAIQPLTRSSQGYEWVAEGFISKTEKKFTLKIDEDYVP